MSNQAETPNIGEIIRTAKLNFNLMNYALNCDNIYSKGIKKNLVITCMDQYEIDINHLLNNIHFNFDKVLISTGDSFDKIKFFK